MYQKQMAGTESIANMKVPLIPEGLDYILPEHGEHYAPFGAIAVAGAEEKIWSDMQAEHFSSQAISGRAEYPSAGIGYDRLTDSVKAIGETSAKNRDNTLLMVRDFLLDLEGEPKRLLDNYVADYLPYVFKEMQVGVELTEAAIAGEEDVAHVPDYVSWLATAPNNQLLNFLQWHNDRTEKINNDPATHVRLRQVREQYASLIRQAVNEGDLPESVLGRLDSIHDIPTSIGDLFDMGMQEREGYHQPWDGHIVLAEGATSAEHFHELSHALLGRLGHRIFNEAMTEHIQLSLRNGNMHLMNPTDRDDIGVYESYRRLMSEMLRSGLRGNLMPEAIRAYCSLDLESPEYKSYEKGLLDSYAGLSILDFIDTQMIEAYELMENESSIQPINPEDDAINYAAQGIRFLGAILKGKSNEDILAPSIRRIRSLHTTPRKESEIIGRLIEERQPRLERIRRYIDESGEQAAA